MRAMRVSKRSGAPKVRAWTGVAGDYWKQGFHKTQWFENCGALVFTPKKVPRSLLPQIKNPAGCAQQLRWSSARVHAWANQVRSIFWKGATGRALMQYQRSILRAHCLVLSVETVDAEKSGGSDNVSQQLDLV